LRVTNRVSRSLRSIDPSDCRRIFWGSFSFSEHAEELSLVSLLINFIKIYVYALFFMSFLKFFNMMENDKVCEKK